MENNNKIETLLNAKRLRVTSIRINILEFFIAKNIVLSPIDIENYFKNKFDRVTIYRTLNTFVENGVLHKVLDDSGVSKYAICIHEHNEQQNHQHHDNHVHFKCKMCNTTTCLHNLEIPNIPETKNLTITSANLLLEGICEKCNTL